MMTAGDVTPNRLESGNITSQEKLDEPALHFPDIDEGKSPEELARIDHQLVRKVDFWLIPWLSLLYLLAFLGRTNIGNARLAGTLEADLGIDETDYHIALSIFFIAYAFVDPVTNLVMRWASPRVFFTTIVITWGTITTLTGLCNNYSGLLAARWFLGMIMGGLFPGVNYYLSCWYRPSEIGLRTALFFAAAALAGAFSGLLAAAIIQMNGVAGLSGWQWIFILEGLATVVCGVACWWMIFDWPATARFLSADDRIRMQRRLAVSRQATAKGADSGKSEEEGFDKRYVYAALTDWKTYGYMFIYMGSLGPLYAFSLFLPTIIGGMGYSGTRLQLFSVPPYVAGVFTTIIFGFVSDRTRMRGYCNMASASIAIVGFIMLIASPDTNVQYAGTFLGAAGIYPTVSNTLAWLVNNTEGSLKRGVTVGIVVGWGTLNAVTSSNVYLSHEKPRFWTGHSVVLAYLVGPMFIGSLLMHLILRIENHRRRAGRLDAQWHALTAEEQEIRGDKRPDFIYTL